jgi:hypothetical protein
MASRLRKLAFGGALLGTTGLFGNWIWDDLHSTRQVRPLTLHMHSNLTGNISSWLPWKQIWAKQSPPDTCQPEPSSLRLCSRSPLMCLSSVAVLLVLDVLLMQPPEVINPLLSNISSYYNNETFFGQV